MIFHFFNVFLVADTQLYKRLYPSVRPSVRLSIRPSVPTSVRPLVRNDRVKKWEKNALPPLPTRPQLMAVYPALFFFFFLLSIFSHNTFSSPTAGTSCDVPEVPCHTSLVTDTFVNRDYVETEILSSCHTVM